jgi:CheY-like chemotaxis protein
VCAKTVVYIDDDTLIRTSVCELLRSLGVEVCDFERGIDALAHIAADPPKAVLIDLNMPGMSGFELAALIRNACGRELRLVAYSGVSTPEQCERALRAGFDDFLTKPVPGPVLIRALRLPSEHR